MLLTLILILMLIILSLLFTLLTRTLIIAFSWWQDLITNVSMYVSIALVVILLMRMGYAFHAQKCCNEAWDHKVRI